MADIDVERKGAGIWPWIIGALALLLLAWLLWGLLDDDDDADVATLAPAEVAAPVVVPSDTAAMAAAAPAGSAAAAALPAELQSYLSSCTGGGEMGPQHDYTADCLQQLAAALGAVTTRQTVNDTDVSQRLATMRDRVQALRASPPQNSNHANITRDAMSAANEVMAAMNRAYFANEPGVGDAVERVQQAYASIRAGAPMLDQSDAVHGYFRQTGEALRTMATRLPAT